jgi:hypothetical protein
MSSKDYGQESELRLEVTPSKLTAGGLSCSNLSAGEGIDDHLSRRKGRDVQTVAEL